MKIYSLFSGSSGNSTLVTGKNSAILIDAGKNCKAITGALCQVGLTISDLSAIFVTHEHTDHISALDVISRRYHVPIHITKPSACFLSNDACSCAEAHPLIFEASAGEFKVKSFQLSHDSAAHVGYIVEGDGERFGLATDTGYVPDSALSCLYGCDRALIESNHDRDMLVSGPYPYYLKRRILASTGHLSNSDCARFAVTLAKGGTKSILLGHLSHENNTPEAALYETRKALDNTGFQNALLAIALRDSITPMI